MVVVDVSIVVVVVIDVSIVVVVVVCNLIRYLAGLMKYHLIPSVS